MHNATASILRAVFFTSIKLHVCRHHRILPATMKNIIESIRKQYPVSDASIEELRSYLTPCSFPKRHQLIKEGIYCKYAYFIEKGILRAYWVVDGEEFTTSFGEEGCIVFSMDELYYDKPSEEYVEALDKVEAYRISIQDLRHLFTTNLEICNWGRIIHQNEYRRLHRSHKEQLSLPAHERYEAFRKQFPNVCKRVSLKYIASYLGITLSTLSRLRGRRQSD